MAVGSHGPAARGHHRSGAGGVDAPRCPGRPDHPAAAGRHRDQQPPAFPGLAGEDGGDGPHHRGRPAGFRDRRRGSRAAGANPAVREFEAYGVPLVSPGEAVRDLAQSCAIVRQLWSRDEPFDFDGHSVHLRGAVCAPKPLQKPHPPILIGGAGDRVLRVVAEHADVWNYPGEPSAEFRRKNQVLNEHCAAIGRDPGDITRSMQTVVPLRRPAGTGGHPRPAPGDDQRRGHPHRPRRDPRRPPGAVGSPTRSSSPSSPKCGIADRTRQPGQ